MGCEGLLNRLGYECREIAGHAIMVSTPFQFADGETIAFYVETGGDGAVTIHDNADTLMHLAGMGMDVFSSRRKWITIRSTLSRFGFQLDDAGLIIASAPKDSERRLISGYIGALLAIVDEVEREYLGLTEEEITYVHEVEMALRAAKPLAPLEYSPVLHGHSGKDHKFHFLWDGIFVEAAQPHGTRTGWILRKAFDIRHEDPARKILVIMDDRTDPDRAKAETDILSAGSISVAQFSTFKGDAVETAH